MKKSAKEIAYLACFTALLIGGQFLLSSVPGVEMVTLLFVCYAYAFGVGRGLACALSFSLLRQFVFGFYPTVLVLYLLYFSLLAIVFGLIGKWWDGKETKRIVFIALFACFGTLIFNLIDVALNCVWYGYTPLAAKMYFMASWSFTLPQIICTALSVGICFLPLQSAMRYARKQL